MYTFSIIKPNAFLSSAEIIEEIRDAKFNVVDMKALQLTRDQAEKFYFHLRKKPFFESLIQFMISGPITILILEKDKAVEDFRKLIGDTDPKKADEGTLRSKYGLDITKNGIHGSDSPENAIKEIEFFFPNSVL